MIYIDFEYRNSNEGKLDLVCSALYNSGLQETKTFWLHDSEKDSLKEYLYLHGDSGIVCFNASAEARSFLALGINPREFPWIDLMVEWKMARNYNLKFMYGKISKGSGKVITSHPLLSNSPHDKVGGSLADMVLNLCDTLIDGEHKNKMRDLILTAKTFTEENKQDILEYCASDILYMEKCWEAMPHNPKNDPEKFPLEDALWRGRAAVNMAVCENHGYPIDEEKLFSLVANHEMICSEAIHNLVKVYPFYEQDKKGKWVKKASAFKAFVEALEPRVNWPKTPAGGYATDEETIEKFRYIPEIEAYRSCTKTIRQVQWFRPDAVPDFLERLGNDGFLRSWLNPYGTLTSRNAPPAKQFVPAMSAWLRSMIRPREGWAITGADYSSEEFLIAAALSKDPNMLASYHSGDPYLAFAKLANAVPQEATKKTHPDIRDRFKSTVLGSQYGMRAVSLSQKISYDTGTKCTEQQAQMLLDKMQAVYPFYYRFLDRTELNYRTQKMLKLQDGWILWLANDKELSPLTFKNFPMQGNGAAIMRHALDRALDLGLRVMFPLHDAFYIYHREDDLESPKLLKEAMEYGCKKVIGEVARIDFKTLTHEEVWVEQKGKQNYEAFSKYLTSHDWEFVRMKYR